jgi:hypothetical protein
MDLVFPLLFLGIPLAYLVLQVCALSRWDGTFRLAAALPVLGWLLWGANFAVDVTRDPTSHNLFPFEILIGAVVATVYLGLLAIFRRLAA